MRAITKKDIGNVKTGTLLEYTGGVFAYNEATFLAEDVLTDDIHFELLEETSTFEEVLLDVTQENSYGSQVPYIRAQD